MLASGIAEMYHNQTIMDIESKEKREVLSKYLCNFDQMVAEGTGIVLCGMNGTGKTLFATLVAKYALLQGKTATMVSLSGMKSMFTAGWREPAVQEAYEGRIRNCTILVIDDLGKEFQAGAGLAEVLLDNTLRYRTYRRLPTIITTNLAYDREKPYACELGLVYGNSIASLLLQSCIVVGFLGRDHRISQAELRRDCFEEMPFVEM